MSGGGRAIQDPGDEVAAREDERPRLAGSLPASFAFWIFVIWVAATALWWTLAFAPLPPAAVWLAEARTVCFGTLPDGLPDDWGWVSLIGSPLAMLGFLLAVWGRELRSALAVLPASRTGRAVLVGLLVVPLLGAWMVGSRVAAARRMAAALELERLPDELPEGYPRGEAPAPALRLVDQSGRELDLESLRGRPVLVTFAYAHCRTVCPLVVSAVRDAALATPELEPSVVVVTLDPWRDRPSGLAELARGWSLDTVPRAHVLSGEVDRVVETLEAWKMAAERDARSGDIVHPALVYVLDPEGREAFAFHNPPAAWLAEAVRRVAAG